MEIIWFLFGIAMGLMFTGVFVIVFCCLRRRQERKEIEEEYLRLLESERKEMLQ